eukprot:5258748-Ditylum_brightwellii.AAC.1
MSFESVESVDPGPTGYDRVNNKMEDEHRERKDMQVMWLDDEVMTCWIVWLSLQQMSDAMPTAQLKREERKYFL